MHRLSTCWQPFAPAYVTHYVVQQFYIRITLCLALVCGVIPSFAQSPRLGINSTGAAPAPAAILDMREPNTADRTRGMLIPRIELTAANVAAPVVGPANGLLVYNTASSSLTGADAQHNVTPGYYIWDTSRRWLRYDALVRRPMLYTTAASSATTTTGNLWFPIPGLQSITMPLLQGDRVELKASGTATTGTTGEVEGMMAVAVDQDGLGYNPLPNGTGRTVFAVDNGTLSIGGIPRSRSIPYTSWSMSGVFDVPVDGDYTFRVQMMRLSGSTGISSGGATYPNSLKVEVIRP